MTRTNQIILILLLLAAIISFRLFLLYWGFIYDGFLVPPGDDAVNHLRIIQKMIDSRSYFTFNPTYPPGYHALIAFAAQIFNQVPFALVKSTGPLLVALTIVASFVTANKWFGQTAAVFTAALVGLAGAGPILSYADGNYPNLLASGFFMVLAFGYFVAAFREKPYKNGLIAGLMFLALAIVHHLSFLLSLVIIGFFVTSFILLKNFGCQLPNFKKGIFFTFAGLIAAAALGYFWYGRTLFGPTLQSVFLQGYPNFSDAYLSVPLSLSQYPETVGALVWLFGIIGLAALGVNQKLPRERLLFIAVWVLTVFILSKTRAVGVPTRFTRELTIPFSISGGYFFAWLLEQCLSQVQRYVCTGVAAGLIVSNVVMLNSGPFVLPEGFNRLIWFGSREKEKLDVLEQLPEKSLIASTPSSPYYELFLTSGRQLIVTSNPTGYNYIFIGGQPLVNPNLNVYPYFRGYDQIKQKFLNYPNTKTIYTFPDSSQIMRVVSQ